MTIEVFSRLKLHAKPVDLDDAARLSDIQMIGVFWFEQDSGNLYFVTDTGLPSPFEVDDGDLYYVVG